MFNKKVQYYLGKYKIYKLGIEERGLYENRYYDHILPEEYKELNFLGNTYKEVLKLENKIKFHSITNLKSSQVLCLNLFIPFMNEKYKHILIDILNKTNVINTKSKIIDFVFEKEYKKEGKTCFDLYLKLEDNTQIFFELKYIEKEFGKYSKNKTKTNVIETYYKKLFKESLNLNTYDLDNKDNIKFFESNYQLFRNVSFIKTDKDHCVFIYPFKNGKCSNEMNNFLLHNDKLKNVHTLDLEELVNCILEEVKNSELFNYFKEFKFKYLNYEIDGFDVIDDTDVDYNYKENIDKIIINCVDKDPIQPVGLYTRQKKEDMLSMIDTMFLRIESLHDINDFLNMIESNATTRLFITRIIEDKELEEYIKDKKLRDNSLIYISCNDSTIINNINKLFPNCNTAISNITKDLVFALMYSIPPYNVYSKILTDEFGTLDNTNKIIEHIDSGLEDKYFVFNTKGNPSIMYSCYKKDIKLNGNTLIIFDIETTGLNKTTSEILKIEAYKIKDGLYIDSFSRVVKYNNISNLVLELTNISEEELNDGISLDDCLKEFFEFSNNSILVSSNISFDFKLLFSNIKDYNKEILELLINYRVKIVSLNNLIDNCKKDLYSKSQKLLNVIFDKSYKKFKEVFLNIQTLNINISKVRNDSDLYHEFIYNSDIEYLTELRVIQNYKTNITPYIIEGDISYYRKNELGYSKKKVEKIIFLHEVVKSMILNNYKHKYNKYKYKYKYKYKKIWYEKDYFIIYNDMEFKLKNDLTATFIKPLYPIDILNIPYTINIDNNVYVVDSVDYFAVENIPKKIILPDTIKSIKYITYLDEIEVLGDSNYMSVDDVLYSKDKRELISYPVNKRDKILKIPDEVAKISKLNSKYIEKLIIGKSVSKINCYLPNLNSFEVDKDNKFFSSLDGVLYNKDFTRLIQYPNNRKNDSFILLDSVKHIDNKIESPNLINLHIGKSFMYKYDEWIYLDLKYLENISVSESNMYLSSYDGILYTKNMERLILYPSNKKDKEYNIPDTVNYIESFALCNYNLEKLVLSESLDIDHDAIRCCNLKSIVIKENNKTLDKNKLSITNQYLILVDDVLYKKDNLSIITTCNKNYIKIIEGVEYIEKNIYTNTLELPNTVKEIDSYMLDVEEVIVSNDNKYYCLIDGVLYSKDKRTLVYYPYTKKDPVFVVPEFVERIECRFRNDDLEELVISNNVSECSMCNLYYIGERIKKITLPSKFKDKVLQYPEITKNINNIYRLKGRLVICF